MFAEAGRALTGPRAGAPGSSCPPASPRTRPPGSSSRTWSRTGRLAALYGFENEDRILPRRPQTSCASARLALRGTGDTAEPAQLVFKVRRAAQIAERRYRLTADDISCG
ncbi:hypothetical protein LT493_22245 [Streptomyces tricolor]|nr:hypothetical protein [Streptomyces tricolor]